MATLRRGSTPADRLSASLVGALTAGRTRADAGPRRPGGLVGLEHEFRVALDGRPLDFRQLIHTLPIDGRRVDPADPDAYRCTWGGTITADGREAEIAIPPVAAGSGAVARALMAADRGRAELAAVLPEGASLAGYSTHLSVSIPSANVEQAAELYARHFSPAMAMLLDGPDSPGLLIRPRAGRLELGGEYADGPTLAAALTFALGSGRAVARAAGHGWWGRRRLPPALAIEPAPAVERFGWFVGDREAGAELHRLGRAARLPRPGGQLISAGEHLAAAWAIARRELDDLDAAALELVDHVVAGRHPLGIERPHDAASQATLADRSAVESANAADAFGSAMRARDRPGFRVEPALVSWDFVVLRLDDGTRAAYACFPRDLLGDALAALDDGRLDALMRAYLAVADGDGRVLASPDQTNRAGLYGGVARAVDLLATERAPVGGGGKRQRRPDDRRDDPGQPRSDGARVARTVGVAAGAAGLTLFGIPAGLVAAAAGTVGVVVVAGVLLVGGGAGSPAAPTGSPAPSAVAAVSPTATIAPSPIPTATPSATPLAEVPFDVATATGTMAAGGGVLDAGSLFQNDGAIGVVTIIGNDTVRFEVKSSGTGASLAIIGTAGTASTTTGAGLTLSFGLPSASFTSGAGECTVQVTSIAPTRVEGVFACPTIAADGSGGSIPATASGTFSFDASVAAPPPTPTPAPTPVPTAKPTPAPITELTTGSGSIAIPGIPLVDLTRLAVGQLGPGNVALLWVHEEQGRTGPVITDSVLIFGTDLPAGTYATSATTGVQIALANGTAGTSIDGGCVLQVERPTAGGVTGVIDCRVLPGVGQGIVVKFEAQP